MARPRPIPARACAPIGALKTGHRAGPGLARFSYAYPEHLLELVSLMITHGYPDSGIEASLGGNYVRVCSQFWK